MTSPIGFALSAALGWRSAQSAAARYLNEDGRLVSRMPAASREAWLRRHAEREGRALGFAFRAAEDAYDRGVSDTRKGHVVAYDRGGDV